MQISDSDLEQRLTEQKIDPQTGELFIKEMYIPEPLPPPEPTWEELNEPVKKKKKDDEEEEEEEEDEEEEEGEEGEGGKKKAGVFPFKSYCFSLKLLFQKEIFIF